MNKFSFTKEANLQLMRLDQQTQNRILEKLEFFKNHPNIFSSAVGLKEAAPATHRLRIGNYRAILHLKSQGKNDAEFIVLEVGHRREIYQ